MWRSATYTKQHASSRLSGAVVGTSHKWPLPFSIWPIEICKVKCFSQETQTLIFFVQFDDNLFHCSNINFDTGDMFFFFVCALPLSPNR